jgi:hypothetical protein
MKTIECADYDSMGNQGRFPMKKKKVESSILEMLIEYVQKIVKIKK